jgi:hypothetical protein
MGLKVVKYVLKPLLWIALLVLLLVGGLLLIGLIDELLGLKDAEWVRLVPALIFWYFMG